MPIIPSTYRARSIFKDAHFSTIYSAKIRRTHRIAQKRERVELPDGDFLDIDWSYAQDNAYAASPTKKIALLFHGLEGNAQRPYMTGLAKLIGENGYDAAAVNFRGCSGTKNRLYRSYHSGDTDDINFIVKRMVALGYTHITLYGVSLGGNAVLKYLGQHTDIPQQMVAASCIGVPIDLKTSLEQLAKFKNSIYRLSFLSQLRAKYRRKMADFPEKMNWKTYNSIRSLQRFDDVYTAPAHGFKDALDYYVQASSLDYLDHIKIPTLILNAKNDSFLHGNCYPKHKAASSTYLHLEIPDHGGHIGFYLPGEYYYNEVRTLEFFNKHVK